MQEKTTQQLIKEYEANMPSEILDIIKTFDWKRELRTIVEQNQIMIDVGSDIEESVYLMILGIVTVDDVYERMIDVHEYSEDKTKKILQEIESRIFNPMTKVLSELDEPEPKDSIVTRAQQYSASSGQVDALRTPQEPEEVKNPQQDEARDTILKQIEEEPEDLMAEEATEEKQQEESIKAPSPIELSSSGDVKTDRSEIKKGPMFKAIPRDEGVRKPFSMQDQQQSQTQNQESTQTQESTKYEVPKMAMATALEKEEDSMSAGFSKPTQMEAPKSQTETTTPGQPRTIDPYREPIE